MQSYDDRSFRNHPLHLAQSFVGMSSEEGLESCAHGAGKMASGERAAKAVRRAYRTVTFKPLLKNGLNYSTFRFWVPELFKISPDSLPKA
jgi:hypothetical protein